MTGAKWPRLDLSYSFVNHTTDIGVARQEEIIRAAFDRWEAVTTLRFTQIDDCGRPQGSLACFVPDIRILFGPTVHSNHPDDPPFDALAHAFAPTIDPPWPGGIQTSSLGGDIHFNDEIEFIDGPYDLFSEEIPLANLALHEIGHAIGLVHTNHANCFDADDFNDPIMCSRIGYATELAPDDIAGIRTLYGTKRCANNSVTVELALGQRPTARRDVILGTPNRDSIGSGGGNDVICGGGGNDRIDGGPGDDRLVGGAGADTLLGREGRDRLEGGRGRDVCNGGTQRDSWTGCEVRSNLP